MGKVMRHTLGASLNIRHNLSSSKGPKPLQLKLLTTYIPKTSAFTDRKSGSAGMPRPISYAVFCLKKNKDLAVPPPPGSTRPIGPDLHGKWGFSERVRLTLPERALITITNLDNR